MPFPKGHKFYEHPNVVASRFQKGREHPLKGTGVGKKEHDRRYYQRHKEEHRTKARIREAIKKDQYTAMKRKWAEENREKSNAIKREWAKKNKLKVSLWDKDRRTRKVGAKTKEADLSKIAEFYLLAEHLSGETGIKYTVDHIRPISKGGLHHQDNLQVITLSENSKKCDKYPYSVSHFFKPKFKHSES